MMKYFCFGVVGMVRRKFMGAAVFDSACRAFSTGIIIIKIAVSPHRSPEPFSGRTSLFTDRGREHEYLCQFVSSQAPRCGMTLTAICAPLSFKWRSRAALRGAFLLVDFLILPGYDGSQPHMCCLPNPARVPFQYIFVLYLLDIPPPLRGAPRTSGGLTFRPERVFHTRLCKNPINNRRPSDRHLPAPRIFEIDSNGACLCEANSEYRK